MEEHLTDGLASEVAVKGKGVHLSKKRKFNKCFRSSVICSSDLRFTRWTVKGWRFDKFYAKKVEDSYLFINKDLLVYQPEKR